METPPSQRTIAVLGLLLGAMTCASVVLLTLQPGSRRLGGDPLMLARAATPAAPTDVLFTFSRGKRLGRWDAIRVQVSGEAQGSSELIRQEHLRRGMPSLGYHFIIGNGNGSPDGQIEIGERWHRQDPGALMPPSGAGADRQGVVEICLVGDFRREGPSEAQLRELVWLVHQLQGRTGLGAGKVDIEASGVLAGRARMFPTAAFRQQLLSRP